MDAERIVLTWSRPVLAVAAFSLVVNLLLLVPARYMLRVFDRVFSLVSEPPTIMPGDFLAGVA